LDTITIDRYTYLSLNITANINAYPLPILTREGKELVGSNEKM
jgi:hypothetical protein